MNRIKNFLRIFLQIVEKNVNKYLLKIMRNYLPITYERQNMKTKFFEYIYRNNLKTMFPLNRVMTKIGSHDLLRN